MDAYHTAVRAFRAAQAKRDAAYEACIATGDALRAAEDELATASAALRDARREYEGSVK